MRQRKRKQSPKIRYFYYNGDLHKKIHINRGSDVITAWNYPKEKISKYSYTAVRRDGEKAFTTAEVERMINRGRQSVNEAILDGMIPRPQITYGLDSRKEYAYYWSEKDIMNLHAYFQTVHTGRLRKDGLITPKKMPSASELRAMIRQGTVMYIKNDAGDFVPTWQAEKF